MKVNLKKSAQAAVFSSIIAIVSQFSVPLTPVPLNFTVAAVILCGALLGKKYGSLSVFIYILMGCVGIPVFSGFRGGVQVLAGVTGGYIIGYPIIAFSVGLAVEKSAKPALFIFSEVIGLALCYLFGTVHYCLFANVPPSAAVSACVLPFLPADAVKILLCSAIYKKIKPLSKTA